MNRYAKLTKISVSIMIRICLLKYRRYVVTCNKDKNLVTNIITGDSESFSFMVQLYQNRL